MACWRHSQLSINHESMVTTPNQRLSSFRAAMEDWLYWEPKLVEESITLLRGMKPLLLPPEASWVALIQSAKPLTRLPDINTMICPLCRHPHINWTLPDLFQCSGAPLLCSLDILSDHSRAISTMVRGLATNIEIKADVAKLFGNTLYICHRRSSYLSVEIVTAISYRCWIVTKHARRKRS